MALLECVNIRKCFGAIHALDDVNWKIAKNKTINVIIGPNGAGKTTLINVIAGDLRPDSGSIIFKGREITKLPTYERVKMGITRTYQFASIFSFLTVREHLELVTQKETIIEQLKPFGLENKLETKGYALSYGEKKKLELALAVCLKPILLILDEPFSGLSDVEISDLCNILLWLKENFTLLVIEHKVSKIISLADRLSVLFEGKIIADGEPDLVINSPIVRRVYWRYAE